MDFSSQFDAFDSHRKILGTSVMGNRNGMLSKHPVLGLAAQSANTDATMADMSRAPVERGTRYHGTNVALRPGDSLMSAVNYGITPKFSGNDYSSGRDSAEHTHSTASPGNAVSYAKRAAKSHGGDPHVYEVEHEGLLSADPESPRSSTRSRGNMKILREVPAEKAAGLPSNPRHSRWE